MEEYRWRAASKRHHYVPRCWLLGFTEDGKPDGRLYVTDLKRRNQFRSSPPNVGYRKFFNRIEGDPDPDSGEKLYQVIEDATAPLSAVEDISYCCFDKCQATGYSTVSEDTELRP